MPVYLCVVLYITPGGAPLYGITFCVNISVYVCIHIMCMYIRVGIKIIHTVDLSVCVTCHCTVDLSVCMCVTCHCTVDLTVFLCVSPVTVQLT